MWNQASPFIFDGPLPPDRVIGRQLEADTIRTWAGEGRFMALVAPRRFGKTSLIKKVVEESANDNLTVVVADLYEVASTADLVLRLERAWSEHTPKRLRRAVTKVLAGAQVGVSIAGSGFAVTLADRPKTDPLPALHALLDLPTKIGGKGAERSLVVFDEFQSVSRLVGAEAVIRSHAQHQRRHASYLFAGSEPGMVEAAFEDRARPFYGQVEMFHLDRLSPAELFGGLESRFQETARDASEVIGELIRVSEGHPQRTMLLAHLLWQQIPERGAATRQDLDTAVEAALVRIDPEARAVISGLTGIQRKVLRAVAEYGSPMAARALKSLDLLKPSAQSATPLLVSSGLIEETDLGWRVVDPFLALWLRHNYATRP